MGRDGTRGGRSNGGVGMRKEMSVRIELGAIGEEGGRERGNERGGGRGRGGGRRGEGEIGREGGREGGEI